MIIKSLPHKKPNFKSLLSYMFKEEGKEIPKEFERFVITHNIRSDGQDLDGMTMEFMDNESLRLIDRKNSNRIYHEVLSFHPEDTQNLNTEKLKATVNEYISLRGRGAMYVAVPHFEGPGGNLHIHLAISGLQKNGRAFRISKDRYNSIRQELQIWQQKQIPELTASIVPYGKNQNLSINDKEHQLLKREGVSQKETIRQKVEDFLNISASMTEFKELLEQEGIRTYDRRGQLTGVLTQGGRKHRLSRLTDIEKLKELKERSEKEEALIAEQVKDFEELRDTRSESRSYDTDMTKDDERDVSDEDDKDITEREENELEQDEMESHEIEME